MKVLGIDIGTATTGWAVLSKEKGILTHKVWGYGVITTASKIPMPERLNQIFNDLTVLIKRYSPDHLAVEDIFFFKNQKTVITVGQARGVVLLAGKKKKLDIFNYTPLQVKQAVTGYGRADKEQVQIMVAKLLKLKEIPKPDDAADALAIGICHLNSQREPVNSVAKQ